MQLHVLTLLHFTKVQLCKPKNWILKKQIVSGAKHADRDIPSFKVFSLLHHVGKCQEAAIIRYKLLLLLMSL